MVYHKKFIRTLKPLAIAIQINIKCNIRTALNRNYVIAIINHDFVNSEKIHTCQTNFNEPFYNTSRTLYLYIHRHVSLQEERIKRYIIALITIRV